MIFKCPNCGNEFEYSAEKDSMVCEKCSLSFDETELNNQTITKSYNEFYIDLNNDSTEIVDFVGESQTMVETADNTTEMKDIGNPEYIIPFEINRETAESIVRNNFRKGFFVPGQFKNFRVENLRGVYVPFWLMDIKYEDDQGIMYSYYSAARGHRKSGHVNIHAKCRFHDVPVDASSQLNDYSSKRLLPYDMSKKIPFDAKFISGYCVDKFDVTAEEVENVAFLRCKELYDKQMLEVSECENPVLESSNPQCQINEKHYVLLPVWFVSFKDGYNSYTVTVNGQTGKMVGVVPYNKTKAAVVFSPLALGISAVLSAILIPILNAFWSAIQKGDFLMVFIPLGILLFTLILLILYVWSSSIKKYLSIKKSIELTNSSKSKRYMEER